MKASMKNHLQLIGGGSWWSSSLYPSVPMFFSQWPIQQLLTLLSSLGFRSRCFTAIALCHHCCLPPLWWMLCYRECHGRSPLWTLCHTGHFRFFPARCLAADGILGGCFAAVGSSFPSLVDAFLPRTCWPSLGGYLDVVVVWSSLVNAFVAGCSSVFSLGRHFATIALSFCRPLLR